MSIHFSTKVPAEGSSIVINIAFKDEDGNAVVPDASSVKWHLTDLEGTVMNERENVSETSAASIDVLLKGNDLEIQANEVDLEEVVRELAAQATYTSSLGSNIPLKNFCRFKIKNSRYFPASS